MPTLTERAKDALKKWTEFRTKLKKRLTSQRAKDWRLVEAARKGDAARVARLLADGADPKRKFDTSGGETAIVHAVEGGHVKAAEALLAAGASADLQLKYDTRTPMVIAVEKRDEAMIRALVAGGASLEYRANDRGETPLVYAVRRGDAKMAELLVSLGANVNASDRDRNGPLAHAADRGDWKTMEMLLEKGARADALNAELRTPLDVARHSGRPEIYVWLRDYLDARTPAWQDIGDNEIANVSIQRKLGYRLTEIFNFEKKQVKYITHNYETGKDDTLVRDFADVASKEAITQAEAILRQKRPAAQPGAGA